MKRRILMPTDFSKNAKNAIDYAMDLYQDDVCTFFILNTYDIEPFTMELTAISDMEESKKKSITGLSNILKRLSAIEDSNKHHYHMISECGSLIDIMQEIIDTHNIDIVSWVPKEIAILGHKFMEARPYLLWKTL